MPIIRTQQTANFTICANGYANDIKRRFSIGLNKVYRCMRELISASYADEFKLMQQCKDWIKSGIPLPTPAHTASESSVLKLA